MTTALQIITSAAKLIQVLRKGEALDNDEAVDGLTSLNDMLASWSNNSMLIPSRTYETFTLTSGSSFLIGAGQTLNTVRPNEILPGSFIRSGSGDYPLTILNDEQYQSIFLKSLSTNIPEYINYDNAFPYGTINLYPAVSGSCELHLMSEKTLSSFASLNTTVNLPAGWNRALRYNLAVEIAAEYSVDVPPSVAAIAALSLDSIMLMIAKNRKIRFKPNTLVKPNIYSGIA